MLTEAGRRIVAAITQEIGNLSPEDVAHIFDALKVVRGGMHMGALSGFKSGDLVEFTARGRTVAGIVLDINRKTVSIKETGGQSLRWRVSPSLLRPYVPKVAPLPSFSV